MHASRLTGAAVLASCIAASFAQAPTPNSGGAGAPSSSGNILPSFEAVSLTGKPITAAQLIGQPSVLIVTPSRDAAEETRRWAQALRKNIDESSIRIRDVLALDLPFFISDSYAIDRAKEKIPARYHDQTWLLEEGRLESALDVPGDGENAYVFVLDARGRVVARVTGEPTRERLNEVESAVQALK